jgi:hypothetical protein
MAAPRLKASLARKPDTAAFRIGHKRRISLFHGSSTLSVF